MPVFIVLLGPPGVGKGTQAEMIAKAMDLPHISSGDLFRDNIKDSTELGKMAQSFMNKGELVPDEVTIGMIRNRLILTDCMNGAVLDGFPRTIVQAAALDKLLGEFGGRVGHVPFITAPESVLVERLGGRWTCKAQGHVFHEKHNPPKKSGICDIDGSELYQRDDDKADTVTRRIQVYFAQTAPLIAYYREHGLLSEIDGTRAIDNVTADLLAVLRL